MRRFLSLSEFDFSPLAHRHTSSWSSRYVSMRREKMVDKRLKQVHDFEPITAGRHMFLLSPSDRIQSLLVGRTSIVSLRIGPQQPELSE